MMYQQVIARRYARGLMMSARDKDLEMIEEELKALVDVTAACQDLSVLFTDPAFSPLEQKAVIRRIKDVFHMSEDLYHFLLVLVDKGRIILLPIIHQALVTLLDERRGRVRANIKSAGPMDKQLVKEIEDALTRLYQKEVVVKESSLPELIGGVRVEVGGLIYDGTVKAKLSALRQKLIYQGADHLTQF